MSQTYASLTYHIVFATKARQPFIDATLKPPLYRYLAGGIAGEGGGCILINGMPNHVHILAQVRQDKTIADVIRAIKANSSGWIHRAYPSRADFGWQRGYAVFTVSMSQVARVKRYIFEQELHHQHVDFEAEFLKLLDAHGVPYDPKYVFQ